MTTAIKNPYTIIDHCVVLESTGEPIEGGCHDHLEDAQAHLAALESHVEEAKTLTTILPDSAMLTIEIESGTHDITMPMKALPADTYFTAGAIKALGDTGEIGGYLVAWGSPVQRDSQGEYFTPQTEFRLDYYNERPVLFYHGLADADSIAIGRIVEIIPDERGLYARAKLWLDHDDPATRQWAGYALSRIREKNDIGWSSGSIAHLVEVLPTGEIKKWPLVEGSLTPTPAEPHRTHVQALKTAIQQLLHAPPAPREAAPREASEQREKPTDGEPVRQSIKTNPNRKEIKVLDTAAIEALREKGLDDAAILSVISVLSDGAGHEEPPVMAEDDEEEELPVMAEDDEEEEPLAAARSAKGKGRGARAGKSSDGSHPDRSHEMVTLYGRMQSLEAQLKAARTAKSSEKVPGRSAGRGSKSIILHGRSKWGRLSWQDMVFVKSVLDGAHRGRHNGQHWVPEDPQDFALELADKLQQDQETRFEAAAIKSMIAIKNDEVNYSTLASFGDDFVPDLWRSQLWETPRLDNPVFVRMQRVDMPSNPYELPVEGADITIFSVPETTNETQLGINDSGAAIPDTQVGTAKVTITAGKLAARIPISNELVEDSIIPVAEHWRFKAVRAMEDARDFVILSADATTGTTNINNSGGSISATHRALYAGGDGLLHLPLVDNADPATGMRVDMGGASPTLTKIREARARLNPQILADFGNLVYFCDPLTSVALSSLDEAVNFSINGDQSTFVTGLVGRLDNIPVYVSNQMSLALNTGFVSSTASSNTLGRLLLGHIPSWFVGFRRDISNNMAYDPKVDAWSLVVSMRMGLARRATDVASLLYDILV